MGFRDIFKKKETFDDYIEEDKREERRKKPKLSIDDKIRIEKEKYESKIKTQEAKYEANSKRKELEDLKKKNFEMSKMGGILTKVKQQIKQTGSDNRRKSNFRNSSTMRAINSGINRNQTTQSVGFNNNARGFGSGLLIDQNQSESNSPYLIGQGRPINRNRRRLI